MKALGLALPLVVAAGALSACSSDEENAAAAGAGLPEGTADDLARMSDEIATKLDAGDVCGAAGTADDLRAAVSEAKLSGDLRAQVEAGADHLVNEVNCDSGPEATTTAEDDDEKHGEGEGESGHGSEGQGDGSSGEDPSGPSSQEQNHTPPGQAKIKGGI